MENNLSIGAKIVALRKAKGVTQADLGTYLNISYQAVSKWEREESCPDFDTLSRIAQFFNVPISYFEKTNDVAVTMDNSVEPLTEMLGVCKECGKVVNKGEEYATRPILICKECEARRKRIAQAKAEEEKRIAEKKRQIEIQKENLRKEVIRDNRNKGFIWGGIIAGVIFAIQLFSAFGSANVGANILWSILDGAWIFVFVSQLFWDGAVADCFFAGGKIIGTPGVIFTLDLDGFIFLIGVKLLFAVLRFIIYLLTMLVCAFAGFLISPFTFVFALLRMNRGE